MLSRGKRPTKKTGSDEIHLRTKYADPSTSFLNWVNNLGLEKSFFGKWALYLDDRFSLRRLALLFLFALGLSFLIYLDFNMPGDYRVGDIAPVDVKSPISFQMVDQVATEAKRIEAEKNLPLIFDYEPDVYEPIYSRIYRSFRDLRNQAKATTWPRQELAREEAIKDFFRHKAAFNKELGVDVPDIVFEWLVRHQFSVRIENLLIAAISHWSNDMIVDLADGLTVDPERKLIVREVSATAPKREFTLHLRDVHNMRDKSLFDLSDVRGFSRMSAADKDMLSRLSHALLVPNVTLNKQEMAERQQKARDSVLPVQISIKKNQLIVSSGNPIKPTHLTILDEIHEIRSSQRTEFLALFSALLFVLVVTISFGFLRRFSRESVKVETKDIWVMGLVTVLMVLCTKAILFVTETALVEKFGSAIPTTAFLFLAPVVAGPMLVSLLITSAEVVWIFTVFSGVVVSVMMDLNTAVLVTAIVGGVAAAKAVFSCTRRNDIYWAGLQTGLVQAATILFVYALGHLGEPDFVQSALWSVGAGFVSALLSASLALTFVPMFENVFNYTTDIKLLELGSLNHPLMQDMMLKAPGTYHHCMAVGNMVDAAARDVGANPLLAKVMAYYHDIGKTEHAQYFIENQRGGHNPHDHISPHMSKTILVAHVKDGAEMAIKNKLGKPIVDGILQHHGTTLISYFYNRALEEQDEDVTGHIEESDFRYPGPKPQFKEAALVMLADSIEATARSLDEPTAGRLNAIVENIIESKFMDGQLDECNLTIRDLALIKLTFKRMLQAIYHQRMEYPHMRDGRMVAVPQQQQKRPGKKGNFTA